MASIGSLMVALAIAGQSPSRAAGDAVILESIATSNEVSPADLLEVERFLEDRIHDAWGVEVSNTPPIAEGGRHFYVTLDWRGPRAVFVRLAEGDAVHVDREVEIADPTSGRAILWLAIRSSIERALQAMPPAPTVGELIEQMAEEASAETATVADNEDTNEAPLVEAAPAIETAPAVEAPAPAPRPTSVAAVDEDPIDPRLYASFSSIWNRRTAPRDGTWSTSVLVRGAIDGGLALGPSLQTHYVVGRWLTVGAEVGYYDMEVTPTLSIDHLPITAMASIQPDLDIPLEFGARTTVDIQVVSTDTQSSPAARLLLGPYARSSLPFYIGEFDEANFVAELRLDFAVLRGAYTVGATRYVDSLVGVQAAVGVEYRWH